MIFVTVGIVIAIGVTIFVMFVYAQTCSAYLTKDIGNRTGFVTVVSHNQTIQLLGNTHNELEFVLAPNSVGHVWILYHNTVNPQLLCRQIPLNDNLQNTFNRSNMTLFVSDWKYNYWVPIQKDERFTVKTNTFNMYDDYASVEYIITASQYAKLGWSYALFTPGNGPTVIVTIGNSPHQGLFPSFVTSHEAGPYGNWTINETDIVTRDLSN
ncbi:MAG: hypothetical protein KGL95_06480 [Patescibacteria group bacterium]|nr:hypothetical protein [Patescibacteria group bacterium]